MCAVGGLFVPDRGVQWPRVDPSNAIYQQDLYDVVVSVGPGQSMAMDMPMHSDRTLPAPH
jgi:hypothetical protein